MIRAVIIDDEAIARQRIKDLLQDHSTTIKVVAEAGLGKIAIEKINEYNPDVIFLDIHLPDMDGFKILDKIHVQPIIIFTTAYEQHAIRAYESLSIDYLVKPITQERFDKSIQKLSSIQSAAHARVERDMSELKHLLQNINQSAPASSITIKKGDKFVIIDFDKIAFFKSEDKYVTLNQINGNQHTIDQTLSDLQQTLPDSFLRVHRSYIVNKSCILEMEKYFKGTLILRLNDKARTSIKTGETYSREVKNKLNI